MKLKPRPLSVELGRVGKDIPEYLRRLVKQLQSFVDEVLRVVNANATTHAINAGKIGNQTITPALAIIPVTWYGVREDGDAIRFVSGSTTTVKLYEDGWYSVGAHISATSVAAGTVMSLETTVNGARALSTYRTYLPIPGDTIDDDYKVNDRYWPAGTTLALSAVCTDATGISLRGSRCSWTIRKVAK